MPALWDGSLAVPGTAPADEPPPAQLALPNAIELAPSTAFAMNERRMGSSCR
jgi:hypothetical protein